MNVHFHLTTVVIVVMESIDKAVFAITNIATLPIHPTISAWKYIIR